LDRGIGVELRGDRHAPIHLVLGGGARERRIFGAS
jgi:hypothetical protein